MFRKLKHWFRNETTVEVVENLNDPRELPRPERSFTSSLIKGNTVDLTNICSQCKCQNCLELLVNFTECSICLEPLQGVPICSCMFCGNFTCWNCSEKVHHCPFCRVNFHPNENRVRNFALERILMKLQLPCRHARWGCYARLNHTDRSSHETSCMFAPTSCPLARICGWHGDVNDVARHLKDAHDLTLIATNGITVEIADFRMKLFNTLIKPRFYTVSLTCHGCIFVCKLKLLNQKLRMTFNQIGTDVGERNAKKFEAWFDIMTGMRVLRGTVEISRKQKHSREVVVPRQALLCGQQPEDDVVKINIIIKPL